MFSAPIDVPRVRQLFSRTARLQGAEFLRREISRRMQEKLELVKLRPNRILDAGCGRGADLEALRACYPEAQLFGVDAALAPLQAAAQAHQAAQGMLGRVLDKWVPASLRKSEAPGWLCGDFARLPLAANSLDLIWSNLALHWHPQPDLVFAEWRRALRTEGLLMFSCFGPDTLGELKRAFAAVDEFPHALPFVDMHDLGDMLVHAGFSTPVMDMEKITLTYADTAKLFADVRALGGNPLLSRRWQAFSKREYGLLCEQLNAGRNADGRIELTFEIVYGHAFRPVPTKLASGEAIVRLDFPKKKS